jgi:hypothetical protein
MNVIAVEGLGDHPALRRHAPVGPALQAVDKSASLRHKIIVRHSPGESSLDFESF